MKCFVIGSGGREHAISWKLAQSPLVEQIVVAPGNAGTASCDKIRNVDIAITAIDDLIAFAQHEKMDLTIVGPEGPLALGIVDRFTEHGLPIVGPTAAAAKLESSKDFSKTFMQTHGIPTAKARLFTDPVAAKAHLVSCHYPVVLKADGLAAGKGVIIAYSLSEAHAGVEQLTKILDAKKIIIEDFIRGEEASFIVLTDGEHIVPLASSQDHKARDDGDRGPNTGGMGAYSPTPLIDDARQEKILATVIRPTLKAMAAAGTPFRGFLYAGLMITASGDIVVLEFNARLGDPETQVILMRLESDFAELCLACAQRRLNEVDVRWSPDLALGVVLAARGYPEAYPRDERIEGLDDQSDPSVQVFHAGTRLAGPDDVRTDGGRVLCVTARGADKRTAFDKAYARVDGITWPTKFYRRDIGYR